MDAYFYQRFKKSILKKGESVVERYGYVKREEQTMKTLAAMKLLFEYQVEALRKLEVETLILTSQMTDDTGFYGSPKGLQFLEGELNLRQNFMIFCTGTCKGRKKSPANIDRSGLVFEDAGVQLGVLVEAFLIFEVETLILTSQMTKDTGFYGSPKGLQFLEGEPNLRQNFMIFCTDIPGEGWGGYPGILDDKIVDEYRNKFMSLSFPLTPQVPCINIVMIGEAGSGKSSFLRTFTTALANSTNIKDTYRVSPLESREIVATKKIHLETMYMGDNGLEFPCRFYDLPGITWETKVEDLERIIDRIIGLNANVQTELDIDFKRHHWSPANDVHCILYVIRVQTDLFHMQSSLKLMTEYHRIKNHEDGVRQFVVVTSIDQLGVPNDDMKHTYKYPCVRAHCKLVSEAFGIDLLHVIPVSNYLEEVAPNNAKNAMSLFNLWRVFNSTKEYIERRWQRKETGIL